MTRQEWGIQVKIALMQKDMTQGGLADQVGRTRQYVCDLLNDNLASPGKKAVKDISKILNVEEPEGY